MKKIADTAEGCIFAIFTFLWAGIILLDLFCSNKNYACKKEFLFSNIQILIIVCCFMAMLICLVPYLQKKNKLRIKPININSLTALLFIIQIYIFYNIYFHTNRWDPAMIYWNAEMISRGETLGLANWYFSMYPNNQGIVLLQSVLIHLNRFFGVLDSEGYFFMIAVQCLLTSLTGKLLYRSLKLLDLSEKYSIIGWILYVILLGLSGWNVVTYTDMTSLIFPIAIFYIYLSLKDWGGRSKLKWFGIITLTYWGSKLKPTVLIVFLAIIISEAIHFLGELDGDVLSEKLKALIKFLIALCISLFLFSGLFNYAIRSTGLIINKEDNMGMLHWMMMGLNPVNDGVFYEDDVNFSHEIEGKSERTEAQIHIIKERIKDYGFVGFIKHIGKKSLINFNDGTFAWECEGGFYDVVYPDKNSVAAPFLKSLYYSSGSRYKYLSTIEQCAWIMILFSSVGIIIKKRKQSLVIVLTLIGIILFNLSFEARARYMILYVPFFIMSSMISLQYCEILLKRQKD